MLRSTFFVLIMASVLLAQDKPVDPPQSVAAKEAMERHQAAMVEAQQTYIQTLVQADLLELTDLDTASKAAMQKYQLDEANRIKEEQDRADATFAEHKKWVSQGLPLVSATASAAASVLPTTLPVAQVVEKTQKFSITARDDWQNTIRVHAGGIYLVTASGRWNTDRFHPGLDTGPEGAIAPDSDSNHRGQVVANLEARVFDSDRGGVTETFGIGTRFVLVAQHDGTLQMAMNDWYRDDNAGSLQVNIRRIGTAPGSAIEP